MTQKPKETCQSACRGPEAFAGFGWFCSLDFKNLPVKQKGQCDIAMTLIEDSTPHELYLMTSHLDVS